MRTVLRSGSKERMVTYGQGADLVAVSREILFQPPYLRRGVSAAAHLLAHAVHDDDVPLADVVGIVAFVRIPGGLPEVLVVRIGARRAVLVVAGSGSRTVLVAAPGGIVVFGELLRRAATLDVVPHREHRAFDVIEQPGRGLVGEAVNVGDVARPDHDRIVAVQLDKRRRDHEHRHRRHDGRRNDHNKPSHARYIPARSARPAISLRPENRSNSVRPL